jgi:hypothetical protein
VPTVALEKTPSGVVVVAVCPLLNLYWYLVAPPTFGKETSNSLFVKDRLIGEGDVLGTPVILPVVVVVGVVTGTSVTGGAPVGGFPYSAIAVLISAF